MDVRTLLRVTGELAAQVGTLTLGPPVAYVYNPLVYAARPHRRYLERYARPRPEALLIGMNPGPWGMAQTGVPFGAVSMVRDWLGIEETVGKPPREHPRRPVEGFACAREEVSGARLWGWARDAFGTPERFFERVYVTNYCPLLFLDENARNLTPDKLAAAERRTLEEACDRALRRFVEELAPRLVVGVGAYAEGRARAALSGLDVRIGRILHPSPASPLANRGWGEKATEQLRELGVEL
jgi:single-strand selective monofunctional uracil DNA glycosylase